ncbi:MAG: flagellar basal body protein [Amaricoccus sp.]|uniref:flagellar basal body protein n=1 Tax=Amaricoccus sp. TaxID=1872485 RepID=UPI0039E43A33
MDLNILSLASALARHASARQQVISENVANADTPGYRARDIRSFGELVDPVVSGSPAFEAKRTRPEHVAFGSSIDGFEPEMSAAFGAETPNGNSVSLEDQMMRGAEVQQEHGLAIGVYQKSLTILRSVVASR